MSKIPSSFLQKLQQAAEKAKSGEDAKAVDRQFSAALGQQTKIENAKKAKFANLLSKLKQGATQVETQTAKETADLVAVINKLQQRDIVVNNKILPIADEKPTEIVSETNDLKSSTAVESWYLDKTSILHPYLAKLLEPPKELETDKSQDAAVLGALQQKYCVLIGAAGTGKTTTTKRIIRVKEPTIGWVDGRDTVAASYNRMRAMGNHKEHDENERLRYAKPAMTFVGFTGRSVDQLRKSLPEKYSSLCQTIHACLGFKPEVDEMTGNRRFVPHFNEDRKLPWRLIVVDEISMVSVQLWNQLMAACLPSTQIIVLGDIAQLSPPLGTSVIGFVMDRWPCYILDTIHRQAADNPIIANATKIRKGEMPLKYKDYFDILYMEVNPQKAFSQFVGLVKTLSQRGQFDPATDAVIVAQNIGPLGKDAINEDLVHFFNKPKFDENKHRINPRIKLEIMTGFVYYAVGDKIMFLKNNKETGINNGTMGWIVDIQPNPKYRVDKKKEEAIKKIKQMQEEAKAQRQKHNIEEAKFLFEKVPDSDDETTMAEILELAMQDEPEEHVDDKDVQAASHIVTIEYKTPSGDMKRTSLSTSGSINDVTLAYAFTGHKSQGGEWPTVIILCHQKNKRMLSREWLYTVCTRARKRVILCATNEGLMHALKTQEIPGKNYDEKISWFRKKFTSMENLGTEPQIPVNETITIDELNSIAIAMAG